MKYICYLTHSHVSILNLHPIDFRPLNQEEIAQRREMARQRHAERVAAESLEGATLSDNTPVEAKMTSLTLKSVEEEEQKQVFMAFARVYSGMVKKGQRVFVLGPKYDPTQGLSLENHHRDYRTPPREEPGRVLGEPPSSHSVLHSAQGAAAIYARADPAMDPETRDPGTYHSLSLGPTEPRVHARASSHRESRCRYPIGTTSPWTQEVVPFPMVVETGRLPQHLNLVRASPGSCLNLSDPSLDPTPPAPSPQRPPQPQKEALEEGHHSTPRTRHSANPTSKHRRCPRMPVTYPLVRHTSTHQAGWPAPPPNQSHISINTAHRPAKTPSSEPGTPPTNVPGTEARDRDPRQSKRSREGRKASTRQPPRPEPQPQPRSRPEGPLPLPA
ncbi:hypothetical protein ILYODFUR_015025 [Ilyodon furcidens]|uniref:Uncharacterized protein n=1 Tax=Ilyodon furcidens TaxID=33524 RepID=A0ABV0VGI8_9TELE